MNAIHAQAESNVAAYILLQMQGKSLHFQTNLFSTILPETLALAIYRCYKWLAEEVLSGVLPDRSRLTGIVCSYSIPVANIPRLLS